jgi:hypothetical protein
MEIQMNRNWNDRERDHHDYGRFSRDHDRDHSGQSFGTRHDDDRQRQAARDGSECDPYGRLMTERMGEDDRRGDQRGGRSWGGGSRQDEDDRSRGQGTPDRGQYGRYMGHDDDQRGRSGGQGYSHHEDDEDRRRDRTGEGQGLFGHPEGHSEGSRRRWESRGDDDRGGRLSGQRYQRREDDWYGSRPFSRQDEDERYGSRSSSRYGDEGRGGSWPRYENEGRGWSGDPRGHSEASRQGSEHRGESDRGDSDRGRFSGRQQDEDDRWRSSRRWGHDDRDQGGWFGDAEGHPEASRRGWRNR